MAGTAQKLYLEFEARLESLRAAGTDGSHIIDDFDKKVDATLNRLDARFSKFGEDSLSNIGNRLRDTFRQSLGEIEQAAAGAQIGLNGPVMDVAGAQAAATAARAQADATREIAEAALRAASAEGELTAEMQAYLRAANLAAANSEAEADRLQRHAGWLERVQVELNSTARAQGQLVPAQQRVTASAGQMRAGMQQLSYQVGDVSTQLSTLPFTMQSAAMVFGQQSGQIIQAIALMRGEARGFIGFMSGPWGAVLTGAATVLAMLAASHFDGSEAAKEQEKAAKDLKAAIEALDRAARQNLETSFRSEARAYAQAQAYRDEAREARELTIEKLKLARADLQSRLASSRGPGTVGSDVRAMGAAGVGAEVEKLNKLIIEQSAALKDREDTVRRTRVPLIQRGIEAAMDKAAGATWKYDQALARLNARMDEGTISDREYAIEKAKITRQLDAELDAIQKADAAKKKHSATDRAAAKAAREHAQAQKEIQQQLDGLIAKYDPARQALKDFTAELAKIDRFQMTGDIGAGDALVYKVKAGREFLKRSADAAKSDFTAILGWEPGSDNDPFVQMATGMRDVGEQLSEERAKVLLADPETSKTYPREMQRAADTTRTQTVQIAESWKDAAQSVTGSLNDMANNIRNGGLVDVLTSVLNLLTQLGGMGVFGSKIQAGINSPVSAHADGGIVGYAGGGRVRGSGGPRTDNLLALLSPGEYVVNAAAARGWLPFLDAINYGKAPAYADGGIVSRLPRPAISGLMRDAREARLGRDVIHIEVEANDYFDAKVRSNAARVAAPMATSAALGGADLATRRAARSRRNLLPG